MHFNYNYVYIGLFEFITDNSTNSKLYKYTLLLLLSCTELSLLFFTALEPPTNIILEYSTNASGITTITVSWTHPDSGPERHGYVTVYDDGLRKVKIESNADENNATIVVEENSQRCRSYTVTVVAIRYSYLPSAPVVTKRIGKDNYFA